MCDKTPSALWASLWAAVSGVIPTSSLDDRISDNGSRENILASLIPHNDSNGIDVTKPGTLVYSESLEKHEEKRAERFISPFVSAEEKSRQMNGYCRCYRTKRKNWKIIIRELEYWRSTVLTILNRQKERSKQVWKILQERKNERSMRQLGNRVWQKHMICR